MQGQEVDSEAVAVLGPFPQDPRPQNSRFIHGVLIKPFFLHLILGVSPGTRWALSEALSTRTERETEAWGHAHLHSPGPAQPGAELTVTFKVAGRCGAELGPPPWDSWSSCRGSAKGQVWGQTWVQGSRDLQWLG